ncbi:MAG: D-alanyl-D-alanine carboxypeptidase/D-alanyl-D-alanine-endopeptidase [Thermoleophilia bacterium]
MCAAGTAAGQTAPLNPAQGALGTWTRAHPDAGVVIWRLVPAGDPVPVAEYRPDTPQMPASVNKLLTSTAALVAMGPRFQFRTTLAIAPGATVRAGTLHGGLYLVGSGDPTLSTRGYARHYLDGVGGSFDALPKAVRARGIRRVAGPIVADESVLDSRRVGDQWRSYYGLYCPPLSGVSVNQDYAGATQAHYVTDPPRGAAAQLRAALKRVHVRQAGPLRAGSAPAGAVTIGTAVSPPLRDILRRMNHESDNFIAETLRKDVGAAAGAAGSTRAGSAATTRILNELGVLSPNDRLVDGSGLSRANQVTAATFVRTLAAANRDAVWGPALINSLPRGGEGTLIHRFLEPGLRHRVHAKTGYIDGVSGLAGVVDSTGGVRYAFAFLINDIDILGAKRTEDRIVRLLAGGRLDAATAPPVYRVRAARR